MAKKSKSGGGKPLVIVESPAKARTIGKFLGSDYMIEASIGHIRDLPHSAKQVPAKYKKEEWARYGVNVNEDFDPIYVIPPEKKQQVQKLRDLVKGASELLLATDEDREGEAISWHLCEVLKPSVPVRRLVFHEITKDAIQHALDDPRDIDDDLVRAQETRRIVDRLYGWDVSQLLWKKIKPKLSAGRVQSVAVRLIVEREKQRIAFVSAQYWDLLGRFAKADNQQLEATLVSVDDRRIPAAKDFDSSTGKLIDTNLLQLNQQQAQELAERLQGVPFEVASVDEKPYTDRPKPPFTTSTLTQEANRKLRLTSRQTMRIAQSLYENGHITYMRTDSTTLAKEAIDAARDLVRTQYGAEYVPEQPRQYASKVKNAQEAHEAIRPASHFRTPDQMKGDLNDEQLKLYDLIWKRTVACQMADARVRRISVIISGGGAKFQVGGKTIDFPGYLRAYVEGSDDPDADLADKETVLPPLVVGEQLRPEAMEPKEHNTSPPARYTEATITRTLEELGIGRPSTYAAIIETIQSRGYVFKKGTALVPTWTAFAVVNLLEKHLPSLVDYQFTARMEDELDAISRGEAEYLAYLNGFYFGNQKPGLKKQVAEKTDAIDPRNASEITLSEGDGEPIVVRVGRYGPFLQQGEARASLPEGTAPDEVTLEKAVELLANASKAEEPLGYCPETNKPVFLKHGRFGHYVQRGTNDDEERKNASLMPNMAADDVDLATALKLLTLPREVGVRPEDNAPIVAQNGRYGPYIKCGDDTRSLPAEMSPLDVTLEQALALLAQPKQKRRGFGAAREPMKTFEKSPVTEEPIKLFEGRYGPYVTDGTTNASLPKGEDPNALTFDQAVTLLAERAAKGPPKKKKGKAAKKKKTAAKKKPAKKKTTKKKKSKASKKS